MTIQAWLKRETEREACAEAQAKRPMTGAELREWFRLREWQP